MRTIAYKYRCLPPASEDADLVFGQLRAAHRYYNALVELHRSRRQRVDRCYLAASPRLGTLWAEAAWIEEEILAVRERLKRARSAARADVPVDVLDVQRLRALIREVKTLRREASVLRKAALVSGALGDPEDARLRDLAEARAAYAAETELYWASKNLVGAAVEQAAHTPTGARFRPWTGEGRLGVQVQGGMSVDQLLAGASTYVRLVPNSGVRVVPARKAKNARVTKTGLVLEVGRTIPARTVSLARSASGAARATLWFRVGPPQRSREPSWVHLPLLFHRALPSEAQIMEVSIRRDRVGTVYEWHAVFTLRVPDALPVQGRGTTGVDVGWRLRPDGSVRIAYYADAHGQRGEVVVPAKFLDGKSRSLRRIQDVHLAPVLAAFAAWIRTHRAVLPSWLRDQTVNVHAWRSSARLDRLVTRWWRFRTAGDDGCGAVPGAADAYSALQAWRRHYRHLYRWERHQERGDDRRRDQVFHDAAKMLCERSSRLVLENFRLTNVKEKPEPEDGPQSENHLHAQRIAAAAPGTFREILRQHAAKRGVEVVTVPAAYTTQRCHTCDLVEEFDAATELEHVCGGCGVAWDQDYNAAENLRRAGERLAAEASAGGARAATPSGGKWNRRKAARAARLASSSEPTAREVESK